MIDLTVADVLDKAADHIERVGWIQGDFADSLSRVDDKDCKVCAWGALKVADTGSPWTTSSERVYAAMGAVEQFIGIPKHSLDQWNDEPHRTQAEVVAALRGAAAQVRVS